MLFLKKKSKVFLDKSEQIDQEEQNWAIEKENIKRRKRIHDEYKELTESTPTKLSMSKKALIFLFVNCSLLEIFTGYITVKTITLAAETGMSPDFTPLITIIGTVVGEVIGLACYYAKSTKENTVGGITYDSAAANNFGYPQYNIDEGEDE